MPDIVDDNINRREFPQIKTDVDVSYKSQLRIQHLSRARGVLSNFIQFANPGFMCQKLLNVQKAMNDDDVDDDIRRTRQQAWLDLGPHLTVALRSWKGTH